MNPVFIGAVVVGLAWLLTRKNQPSIIRNFSTPSTTVTAPTPNVYPVSFPLNTPPSPEAQKQANNSQSSANAPEYYPGRGLGNLWPDLVATESLPVALTGNLPPGSDLTKTYLSMANQPKPEPSGCNGCTKKLGCQTYKPSTQFSDGASCLSSNRETQKRNADRCDPTYVQDWTDNILASQGVTRANPLKNVNIPSRYRNAQAMDLYIPASQGILNTLQAQVMNGVDPSSAFFDSVQQLTQLNSYSAINNWDWVNNRPINPNIPYTSPTDADKAVQNQSGMPGRYVPPVGPWGGPYGWTLP